MLADDPRCIAYIPTQVMVCETNKIRKCMIVQYCLCYENNRLRYNMGQFLPRTVLGNLEIAYKHNSVVYT